MKDFKKTRIDLRISKKKKKSWKKICEKRGISLTDLIVHSVEHSLHRDEHRAVLNFLAKQDLSFVKVETNINQIAKIANGQKFLVSGVFEKYLELLEETRKLKREQNAVFVKLYELLSAQNNS